MNILKNKKSKIILLVCCIFIVVAITGGLISYFILANKDKTQEIIISSVDSKATFSLGKHNNVKFTDFNKNFNNRYALEFSNKDDRKNFEIQEINNSSYLINNLITEFSYYSYNVYFDVNGYRFSIHEFKNDSKNALYIEGVHMLASGCSSYDFIPFICDFEFDSYTTDDINNIAKYDSFNNYLTNSTICDYDSFKKEISSLPSDLVTFNDDEQSIIIKIIVFPGFTLQNYNPAMKINCYDDYFVATKIML